MKKFVLGLVIGHLTAPHALAFAKGVRYGWTHPDASYEEVSAFVKGD